MPDEQDQTEEPKLYSDVEVSLEEQAEFAAQGDHIFTHDELHSAEDEDWDPSLRDPEITRQMSPQEAGEDDPPEPFSTGDPYETPFKDKDDLMSQAMAALNLGKKEGLADNAKVKPGRVNRPLATEDNLDA